MDRFINLKGLNNMDASEGLFGLLYHKGDIIFRQGDVGDRMYIIQSGAIRITHTHGGLETEIAIREKGEVFGEMALFDAELRSATATAVQECRLLPLTKTSLLEKMQYDPNVALHFLRGLSQRIQEALHDLTQIVEEDEVLRSARRRGAAAGAGVLVLPELSAPVEATGQAISADAPADTRIHDLAGLWNVAEWSTWVEAGETIFREGEPGNSMYIVLNGTVELEHDLSDGRQLLGKVGQGDFFGELGLVVDGFRPATATAVSRTQLLTIPRDSFEERVRLRPELAMHVILGLVARLRQVSSILANPRAAIEVVRKSWQPLIRRQERIRVAMLSLGTCAGCSAVLLDDAILARVLEMAEIHYAPMLIDQDSIPEADLVLIDGVVRLKEDQEKLEEARARSRRVAAWGSCAAFGGIPAEANRFELEDLITETFGQAADLFAYYLSGEQGVEQRTYQEKGIALLRKAGKLDDYVKVDYYLPGCPPTPAMLLGLLGELTGQESGKAQAVVCGQCGRKPTRATPAGLGAFPQGGEDPTACFNSLGVFCLGFMTQGGCEAICLAGGLPCWACRGPAKIALKKMAEGDSFEEVVVQGIARRCKLDEDQVRPVVRQLRRQNHDLLQFEPSMVTSLGRVR